MIKTKRIITFIIAISFLYENIVFAQGNLFDHPKFSAQSVPASTGDFINSFSGKNNLNNLKIPENIGKIKETWSSQEEETERLSEQRQSKKNKTIIHIQDSHANYEAQSNIARVLESLQEQYSGNLLVAIEGAEGQIDPSIIKSYPHKQAKEIVSDLLMKEGLITGAEFYSVFANKPVVLYGVEQEEIYNKNLEAFKQMQNAKEGIQEILDKSNKELNKSKQTLNQEQIQYMDKVYGYHNDEIGLENYTLYLKSQIPNPLRGLQKACPKSQTNSNFQDLIKLINLKTKINFETIESDRMQLLKQIKNKVVQEELAEIVTKGLQYQVGKLSGNEYFSYLKPYIKQVREIIPKKSKNWKQAVSVSSRGLTAGSNHNKGLDPVSKHGMTNPKSKGINQNNYHNLLLYIEYIKCESKIDRNSLFQEIADIENEIQQDLFTSPQAQEICKSFIAQMILTKFINLRIYREDLKYYKEHKNDFLRVVSNKLSDISKNKVLKTYNLQLTTFLDSFEQFCDLGVQRDKILVERTLEEMNKNNQDIAILITGGFHTKGISDLFRDKGVSYAVVSPKMTGSESKDKYVSLLLGEESVWDKVLAFSGTRLALRTKLNAILDNGTIKGGDSAVLGRIDVLLETVQKMLDENKAFKLTEQAGNKTVDVIFQPKGTELAYEIPQNVPVEKINFEQGTVYMLPSSSVHVFPKTTKAEIHGSAKKDGSMEKTIITIDGPAGTGKSTVAKQIAKQLNYIYLDTGAMYRAVSLEVLRRNIDVKDIASITKMLGEIDIILEPDVNGNIIVYLNGIDVSADIRTPEVSRQVPFIAQIPAVRERLVELQRNIAREYNLVVDGRDMGTVVFPNATIKIYLDASPEVRADRRFKELQSSGSSITYEQVLSDLKERDRQDMTRTVSPLRKADEAIVVDTSKTNIEESIREVMHVAGNKIPEAKRLSEESPDMHISIASIPHDTVNAFLKEQHLLGNTIFIKEDDAYSIVFDEDGNPLSEGDEYVLNKKNGWESDATVQKINESKKLFIDNYIEQLLNEVGVADNDRGAKRNELANIIIVLVHGEMFMGNDKNIIAHAGRARKQITIGDQLVAVLTNEQISRLMYEEAKHILMPDKQHISVVHSTGIVHEEDFIRNIINTVDRFLFIKTEEDLRKLYYEIGINRLCGSPWLQLYLNAQIVKDPRLKTALQQLLNEFSDPNYDPLGYFSKIDIVFKQYFKFDPSRKGWETDSDKVQQVLAYHRAINPEFWLNYSFVRDSLYNYSDENTIGAYLDTANASGFSFAKVVCGIAEAEDVQRPLDPVKASKVIRGPPKSTDYAYVGGGGWTPTDFGWLFTTNPKYTNAKIGEVLIALISNTQDDGGRTRVLQDKVRDLWNMYTIAAGDGVIIAWITANVAKMFLLYKDASFNRDGNLSRVFNIKKITLDDKQLIYWLSIPVVKSKILKEDEYNDFFKILITKKDSLTEDNLEDAIKQSVEEVLSEAKREYERETIDGKKNQVWNVLKSQIKLTGEHVLDSESAMKEMIIEAQMGIAEAKSIQFGGRTYGKYSLSPDWLYFISNVLSLARMANRDLLAPGINDFQNMSWMNTYTILGFLASRMIQRGNAAAGIAGTMHNREITTAFLNELFGIENGFWAPSTYDETTMGMVCEAVGVKISMGDGKGKKEVILNVGRNSKNEVVVGELQKEKIGEPGQEREVYATTKLERLQKIIRLDIFDWKQYPGYPIYFRLNAKGNVLIKFQGKILELSDYINEDNETEEGKTAFSKDGSAQIKLRTDANWNGIVAESGLSLELRSQLVEEQTRITDAEDIHPSPIKKMVWKKAIKDSEGKYVYDEYRNEDGQVLKYRRYSNLKNDEKPEADAAMLNLLRNVKRAVFTAQSSLVTSTMPNYLTKGMVEVLKELRSKGIPVIYLLKPAIDIETAGLTFSEQLQMFERSIQEFIGDANFKITEIFSHVVIPDVDSLPDSVKTDYAKSLLKKKKTFVEKEPLVRLGAEKLSKILPRETIGIAYKSASYQGKKEDLEYLALLNSSGTTVVWTKAIRVWEGKYVYDEEKIVDECSELSKISRLKSNIKDSLTSGFNPISTWNAIFKEFDDENIWSAEDVAEIGIGFDKGDERGYKFTVKVPSEKILAADEELRNLVLKYLSIYIYNRLGALGARKIYINVKGVKNVQDSVIGRILIGRFNFDRKLIKVVENDRSYPDRPYKLIYNYISRVNEQELGCSYVDISVINNLQPVLEPEVVSIDKNIGAYIGVDIGGSDVKIIAIKNGRVLFSKEYDWKPQEFKETNDHLSFLNRHIDEAIAELGLLEQETLDGIGISVNLAVNNERITGLGPLTDGIEKQGDPKELEKIKELGKLIGDHYKVTTAVSNDGDMAALWAAQDMGLKNVLCLAMGTGLAAGYVDKNGNVLDVLGEMGNVVVDMNQNAAGHSFTTMQGVLQSYLSQRPIIGNGRLAEQAGLYLKSIAFTNYRNLEGWKEKFYDQKKYQKEGIKTYIDRPEDMDKIGDSLLLEVAQDLLDHGTAEQRAQMRQIFEEIGKYLAEAIFEISNYLVIDHVMIMGRVTKGTGGTIIKDTAQKILSNKQIKSIKKGSTVLIHFPKAPTLTRQNVEWYKRFGQAVGAVYRIMQKNSIGSAKKSTAENRPRELGKKTSGVGMSGRDGKDAVVVVEGDVEEIARWLNDKTPGMGYKFSELLDEIGQEDKFKGINIRLLSIKIVQGNKSLLHVEGNTLVIDADLFSLSDINFMSLLKAELQEEELLHILWKDKNIPIAVEEIITDYLKIVLILSYSDDDLADVLFALMMDNDIDDQEFFKVIAQSISKQRLVDILGIIKTKADVLEQNRKDLSQIFRSIKDIEEIAENQKEHISRSDVITNTINYVDREGVYSAEISQYVSNLGPEKTRKLVQYWMIELGEEDYEDNKELNSFLLALFSEQKELFSKTVLRGFPFEGELDSNEAGMYEEWVRQMIAKNPKMVLQMIVQNSGIESSELKKIYLGLAGGKYTGDGLSEEQLGIVENLIESIYKGLKDKNFVRVIDLEVLKEVSEEKKAELLNVLQQQNGFILGWDDDNDAIAQKINEIFRDNADNILANKLITKNEVMSVAVSGEQSTFKKLEQVVRERMLKQNRDIDPSSVDVYMHISPKNAKFFNDVVKAAKGIIEWTLHNPVAGSEQKARALRGFITLMNGTGYGLAMEDIKAIFKLSDSDMESIQKYKDNPVAGYNAIEEIKKAETAREHL
jgi:cytidylate kinase